MTVSALMTRTRDAVLPPFEEIVAEHGPVVMRVCRALLGPADAADAWSETFLSALEAYPKLRSESSIRAWLVTIAHRKAIDQRRGAAGGSARAAPGAGRAPPPVGAGGGRAAWGLRAAPRRWSMALRCAMVT